MEYAKGKFSIVTSVKLQYRELIKSTMTTIPEKTICEERMDELEKCYRKYLSVQSTAICDGEKNSKELNFGVEMSKQDGFLIKLLHLIRTMDDRITIQCKSSRQRIQARTSVASTLPIPRAKHQIKSSSDEQVIDNSRAYIINSDPMQVILCSDSLPTPKAVDEALRHELTHVHDSLSKKCNFNDCEGLAYSEIRAARNGECFQYAWFPWWQERCVKEHASRSTSNLFPGKGDDCVARMMKKAFEDHDL
jgi:hypothetical protein